MKNKKVAKKGDEKALCQLICKGLSDQELFFEVQSIYGVTDIVARRGIIVTGIEAKESLSMKVIEQAWNNTRIYHYSYIAVPRPSKAHSDFVYEVLKKYGIGLLIVNPKNRYEDSIFKQAIAPKLNRKPIHTPTLSEFQKQNIPGSQNERMTSWKFMIVQITERLQEEDGQTIESLMPIISGQYKTLATAKQNLYGRCQQGVIKDFYVSKGRLWLNEVVTSLSEPSQIEFINTDKQ